MQTERSKHDRRPAFRRAMMESCNAVHVINTSDRLGNNRINIFLYRVLVHPSFGRRFLLDSGSKNQFSCRRMNVETHKEGDLYPKACEDVNAHLPREANEERFSDRVKR
jgi:hypothetical protein